MIPRDKRGGPETRTGASDRPVRRAGPEVRDVALPTQIPACERRRQWITSIDQSRMIWDYAIKIRLGGRGRGRGRDRGRGRGKDRSRAGPGTRAGGETLANEGIS